MRAPFLMLPLALALAAPLTAVAQEGPKVLFCAGDCAVVDAKGVRRPAPKGTVIPPGFRLITGPGAYAQVKLAPDSAIGLGENANIALQRTHIVLDQGRIRLVGGEAFGKPITRPIELRTNDGIFTLRNADVEMKTTTGIAAPTLVKVNAGDALLGSTLLARDGIQTVSTGRITAAPTLSLTEVALTTKVAALDRTSGTTTLNFQTTSFQTTSFPTRLDTLSTSLDTTAKLSTLTTLNTTTSLSTLSKQITSSEQFLRSTATDSSGQTLSVSQALQDITTINRTQTVTLTSPTTTTLDKSTLQTYDTGTKVYTLPKTSTFTTKCFSRGC